MSMETPKPREMSLAEKIEQARILLDAYRRDLADEATGRGPGLSHEEYLHKQEEIKRLEKELEELKRGL